MLEKDREDNWADRVRNEVLQGVKGKRNIA